MPTSEQAAAQLAEERAIREAELTARPSKGPPPKVPKIVDAARDAVAGIVPLRSHEIERRIAQAEADHASVVAAYGAAALDAEAGLDGAADRFAALQADVKAKAARIEALRAALEAAKEAEQRERFALQARKRKRDLKRIEDALAARDKDAARIVAGIAEAVAGWRDLMEHTDDAGRPIPMARARYGEGYALGMNQLRRLVAHELYRQGAWPKREGIDPPGPHVGNFPGGEPPTADFYEAPGRIKPLDQAIKEGSAGLLRVLNGQRELL